jgi:NAD(P)-dependent dehydrogenase (short-subunit alcohol dehydrogenase family)
MQLKRLLREAFLNHRRGSVKKEAPLPRHPDPKSYVELKEKLLVGKNVLITGAGRNIGRGIAIEMAKQGANIFFADIDQGRCEDLRRELGQYQVRTTAVQSDISKTQDIDMLCRLLVEHNIVIDILVNNVGIGFEPKTLRDLDLREWHQTFDVNLFGPLYLTKNISEMMLHKRIQGSVLFVTSIHQWIVRFSPSYSSSKAALGMVIKELAIDLASKGIRVNGIAPGWVEEDEQGHPLSNRKAPLHHTSINPHYIGRTAVYLASDYFSKFTTGTVIKIDAGLSLQSPC